MTPSGYVAGGGEMRVYRITITWPTPDGKPFENQPWQIWDDALNADGNNPGFERPAWLSADVDLCEHGVDMESYYPPVGRFIFDGNNRPILAVPPKPKRRHFFSAYGAETAVKELRRWGCAVVVTESEPVVWPAS